MTSFQPRPDFLGLALEQFVHAARQLAEGPDLPFEQALDRDVALGGGEVCGNPQLRQCFAFAFLAAALLSLPAQTMPALTTAFGSPQFIRLLFLPPSRGPPSSQQ